MSSRRRLLFGCVGSLTILLGLCGWAAAQQTYTLKLRATVGQKWSFDVNTSIKQKGQVTQNGQVLQPIDQSATQRRKGTLEILAVQNDVPTAVRISYDPDSSNSGNMAGQAAPAFSLAGKSVTLRKGNDGQITNDLPQAPDEATAAELNRMLDPDQSIFPQHPVAVDEQWDGQTDQLSKQFQLGPDDKVSMTCKLLAIKDLDGRQVADVSLAGQVIKHEQGFIETTTTLGGVSRLDLASGQALNADLIGKMATRGKSQVPNPQTGQQVVIEVTADGQVEMHQIVRLVSDAAGAAPPAAATSDKPPMHDNPLAPHTPEAPSFAGSYKGDPLSLDLSGDAAHLTGTMTLADKKFPVTAQADGGKLTGTFETDGNKFDFTATLDGNTLTLTSGGSTYTLKKPAAANPLARPEPRNPLAQ